MAQTQALVASASEAYNEIAVGGCCRNEKLQQYLENDRRVLRFNTFWDDHTKYGSRKPLDLDMQRRCLPFSSAT